jgi:ribonuclease Y
MNILAIVIVGVICAVVALAIGFGIAFVLFKSKVEEEVEISDDEITQLLKSKKTQALKEIDIEVSKIQSEAEERANKVRRELLEQEKILADRERSLNDRSKNLDQKRDSLDSELEEVKEIKENIEELRTGLKTELEKISGLTRDEAKEKLMKQVEEDLRDYEAQLIRKASKRAEEISDEKSKKILVESMQRIVTDYVGETTTSTIKLTDEKVKGRVIGKEGRNIRAFEKATGVDVIVDEAPDSIGLSSFDPLRREIARVAMINLIKDGRIHPSSIEDAIRKAKNEIASEIKKNGQILADEANWPGMDLGLLKLVGKMKYRTSYGQSLMKHTTEVIRIGGVLSDEVGADSDLVRKACLLHDVGKVLTHKVEGAHHHISGQIARKYELPPKLVNAIEAHHLDIEPESIEAVIVYMADAISGARPGARKDSYEQYIKRVEALENIAKEVAGDKIDEVYAIHAGRELRVIVKPKQTSDEAIVMLSKEIADKIQATQTYPGTVEVTVIRENRSSSTAM